MPKRRPIKLPDWPIGTEVRMVNCSEAEIHVDKVWKTRSEPWILSGHTPVVMLEGKSGCFGTDFLEVVNK